MCKWKRKSGRTYQCAIPAEVGSEFCVFHSSEPKSPEDFNAALRRQFARGEPGLNSRSSFIGYVFPDGVTISDNWDDPYSIPSLIPPDIKHPDFSEARIPGDVYFDDADLPDSKVDFSGSEVKGVISFRRARIAWLVFRNASCQRGINLEMADVGWVNLANAHICGDAEFDGISIRNTLDLRDAELRGLHEEGKPGDIILAKASVGGSIMLDGVTVDGDVELIRAHVGGSVRLNDASIGGKLSFFEAEIDKRVRMNFARLGGKLSCNDCEIGTTLWMPSSTVAINEADFDGCVVRHLRLESGKPRIRGRGHTRCGVRIADHRSAVSFWRFAQRAFVREGLRHAADMAYYFERIRRWQELRKLNAPDGSGKWRTIGYWWIRRFNSLLWLLDLVFVRATTAYGIGMANLLATWGIVICGFGVVFSVLPRLIQRAGVDIWTLRNWIVGFHYSVTSFTTLGLGHLNPGPSSLGMVLTSVEALVGAVLIALAVAIIGRRFMR